MPQPWITRHHVGRKSEHLRISVPYDFDVTAWPDWITYVVNAIPGRIVYHLSMALFALGAACLSWGENIRRAWIRGAMSKRRCW